MNDTSARRLEYIKENWKRRKAKDIAADLGMTPSNLSVFVSAMRQKGINIPRKYRNKKIAEVIFDTMPVQAPITLGRPVTSQSAQSAYSRGYWRGVQRGKGDQAAPKVKHEHPSVPMWLVGYILLGSFIVGLLIGYSR